MGCLFFFRWDLRMGYVLRLIFTPTLHEYQLMPLPAALFPLYAFLRPLRLMIKWGWQGLRTAVQRLIPFVSPQVES